MANSTSKVFCNLDSSEESLKDQQLLPQDIFWELLLKIINFAFFLTMHKPLIHSTTSVKLLFCAMWGSRCVAGRQGK